MYDNEEPIDPIILPTAQYQLRRVPQRLQHYDRLARTTKQAPLRRKHVVKTKQVSRPPFVKTVISRKTPPPPSSSDSSSSTSPYPVVVELTNPSSSTSSNSDIQTNTHQHSSPIVRPEPTLPIVPVHNNTESPIHVIILTYHPQILK